MTILNDLNERAWLAADDLAARAEECNIAVHVLANQTRVMDCGVKVQGGLEAGRRLAEICLAGLANVDFVPLAAEWGGLGVSVRTDQPLSACMASQYAGWQIAEGKFFAMGSGPMRVVGSREPLLDELAARKKASRVVGVLETGRLPDEAICDKIASQCQVSPDKLTLLCAPTQSIAGTVQIVARSVETALHKLHTLHYPLEKIQSGHGVAPLPSPSPDFFSALGRTNDSILYGASVTLWVRDTDEALAEIGPRVPSSASADYGAPFEQIFAKYERDFYKIDPLLFSPAHVRFVNGATGRAREFGSLNPQVFRSALGQ